MVIIMLDGSQLTCNTIEFCGGDLIADEYRIVPITEVLRIITD